MKLVDYVDTYMLTFCSKLHKRQNYFLSECVNNRRFDLYIRSVSRNSARQVTGRWHSRFFSVFKQLFELLDVKSVPDSEELMFELRVDHTVMFICVNHLNEDIRQWKSCNAGYISRVSFQIDIFYVFQRWLILFYYSECIKRVINLRKLQKIWIYCHK